MKATYTEMPMSVDLMDGITVQGGGYSWVHNRTEHFYVLHFDNGENLSEKLSISLSEKEAYELVEMLEFATKHGRPGHSIGIDHKGVTVTGWEDDEDDAPEEVLADSVNDDLRQGRDELEQLLNTKPVPPELERLGRMALDIADKYLEDE